MPCPWSEWSISSIGTERGDETLTEFRYTSSSAAEAAGADQGDPYAVMLRRGTLELGFYAPIGVDRQEPHEQDEVYVIVSGTGRFLNGGVETEFGTGDALFVPAGVEHRFIDFSDDTEMWVVFYGPPGGDARDI
jgi:mannose-6-phosphate isomerase-like protein (cupin superfamily)